MSRYLVEHSPFVAQYIAAEGDLPSQGIQSVQMKDRPNITATTHDLPFANLSGRDFEKLCFGLVQRLGFEGAEDRGALGDDQGIDILADRDGQSIAFQCKNVKSFRPADLKEGVAKVAQLPLDERPAKLIFLVASDVSARTYDEAAKADTGFKVEIWAKAKLDGSVRRHDDLIVKFFSLPVSALWLQQFDGDQLPLRSLQETIDDSGLQHALKLLQSTATDPVTSLRPNGFLWSWNVLYEMITEHRPEPMHRDVLTYGLSAIREIDKRRRPGVLLSEGARLEIHEYLEQITSDLTSKDGLLPSLLAERLNPTDWPDEYQSGSWLETLTFALRLSRIEPPVDMLLATIKEYTLPYTVPPAELSTYVLQLASELPGETAKLAPLFDLASAMILRDRASQAKKTPKWYLVTSDQATAASQPDIALDPLEFSSRCVIAARLPEVRTRSSTLEASVRRLERLFDLLGSTGSEPTATETRSSTTDILQEANADTLVAEIERLISILCHSEHNARLYNSRPQQSPPPRFPPPHVLMRCRRELQEVLDTASLSEMRWVPSFASPSVRHWQLEDSAGSRVLQAEMTSRSATVTWQTSFALTGFLETIPKSIRTGSKLTVLARPAAGLGEVDAPVRNPSMLAAEVSELAGNRRISQLRVQWSSHNVWYEPLFVGQSRSQLAFSPANVALSSGRALNPALAAKLYKATAERSVPEQAISHAVEQLAEFGS